MGLPCWMFTSSSSHLITRSPRCSAPSLLDLQLQSCSASPGLLRRCAGRCWSLRTRQRGHPHDCSWQWFATRCPAFQTKQKPPQKNKSIKQTKNPTTNTTKQDPAFCMRIKIINCNFICSRGKRDRVLVGISGIKPPIFFTPFSLIIYRENKIFP